LAIFLAKVVPYSFEAKFYPQSRSLISLTFSFEEAQLEKVCEDFLNIHYSIPAGLIFMEIFIINLFSLLNCF
jgi:hypothetical protein